jgi:hypothetical protein
MYKSGANYRDKIRIVELYNDEEKPKSVEEISALTKVKPEHVQAIIEQVDDGNMTLAAPQVPTVDAEEEDDEEDED